MQTDWFKEDTLLGYDSYGSYGEDNVYRQVVESLSSTDENPSWDIFVETFDGTYLEERTDVRGLTYEDCMIVAESLDPRPQT